MSSERPNEFHWNFGKNVTDVMVRKKCNDDIKSASETKPCTLFS